MGNIFIKEAINAFESYKALAEKAFQQLSPAEMQQMPATENNSIAIIIQHLHGNMLSRWTDFLTTDGEKPNRNRDAEFEEHSHSQEELMKLWNQGWDCVFGTLNSLMDADLDKEITIRNEKHTVLKAIIRQIAHYSYHVGQIVLISKLLKGKEFKSLSIPKGQSAAFNQEMNRK